MRSRASRSKRHRYRPALEPLESRWTPTCTLVQDFATLTIGGDALDSDIKINDDPAGNRVIVGCDGVTQIFEGIKKIVIKGRAGNDFLDYDFLSAYSGARRNIQYFPGRGDDALAFGLVPFGFGTTPFGAVPFNLLAGSRMTIKINDANGWEDVFAILDGDIAGNSTFTMNAFLGEGQDGFTMELDPNSFDLLSSSRFTLVVDGGTGADSLELEQRFAMDVSNIPRIAGTFAVTMWGGLGPDAVFADLNRSPSITPGSTIGADFEIDGSMTIVLNGGDSLVAGSGTPLGQFDDEISALLGAANLSTGALRVTLAAGANDDDLFMEVNDRTLGGLALNARVAGGSGDDTCDVDGDAAHRVVRAGCEATLGLD